MNGRKIHLDFIRIISMFAVLLFHFGGIVKLYPNNQPLFYGYANGEIGTLAVFLFFMVSGCSLFTKYHKDFSIKDFWKKRISKILVPFWFFYIVFFMWNFLEYNEFPNVPLYKLIYTVLGLDGFLAYKTTTFYLIGEWFLGTLLILYFLFPLLNFVAKKNLHITMLIIFLLYVSLTMKQVNDFFVVLDERNLITCIFYFVWGYWLEQLLEKSKNTRIGTIMIILLIVFGMVPLFVELPFSMLLCALPATTAIYALLYLMVPMLNNINANWVFKWLVNNSYLVFLIHHFLLNKLWNNFSDHHYSLKGVLAIMFIWFAVIILCVEIYHSIVTRVKYYKSK